MNKRIIQVSSVIALALLALSLQSFSLKTMKEKKVKTITIPLEGEVINVSADSLWTIVGTNFADAGVWATNVDHSAGHGDPTFEGASCSERSCDINVKGFNSINEKLVQFDSEKRELTYVVDQGFPKFVTLASNHWQVIEVGPEQSKIKMDVTMEMKPFMGSLMGGAMKRTLEKNLPIVANDLKVYAETGEISESKRQRLAQLKK